MVSVSSFAQKQTLYKKIAIVTDIISDRAIISAGMHSNYNVSAKSLEKGSSYVFYLEILEDGTTPKANIKGVCKTTTQAQKDMKQTREALEKNYTIID